MHKCSLLIISYLNAFRKSDSCLQSNFKITIILLAKKAILWTRWFFGFPVDSKNIFFKLFMHAIANNYFHVDRIFPSA